jgi:hypothetical protein
MESEALAMLSSSGPRPAARGRKTSPRATDLLMLVTGSFDAPEAKAGAKAGPARIAGIPLESKAIFAKEDAIAEPWNIDAAQRTMYVKFWGVPDVQRGAVYRLSGVLYESWLDPKALSIIDPITMESTAPEPSKSLVCTKASPVSECGSLAEILKDLPFAARAINPARDLNVSGNYDIKAPSAFVCVQIEQAGNLPKRGPTFTHGTVVGSFSMPDSFDPAWFAYTNKLGKKMPALVGGVAASGTGSAKNDVDVVQMDENKVVTKIRIQGGLFETDVARFDTTPDQWFALGYNLASVTRGIMYGTINREKTSGTVFEGSSDGYDGAGALYSHFQPDLATTAARAGIKIDAADLKQFLPSLANGTVLSSPTTSPLTNKESDAINLANVSGDISAMMIASDAVEFYAVGNWQYDRAMLDEICAMPTSAERTACMLGQNKMYRPMYRTTPPAICVYAISKPDTMPIGMYVVAVSAGDAKRVKAE